jgi:hypothetical protein
VTEHESEIIKMLEQRIGRRRDATRALPQVPTGWGGWVCQVFCVNGHVLQRIPGRLNGPERRVGLCGDATRAPTQGPGFRGLERSSAPGPGILARMRKISGFGAEPHPENVLLPISS